MISVKPPPEVNSWLSTFDKRFCVYNEFEFRGEHRSLILRRVSHFNVLAMNNAGFLFITILSVVNNELLEFLTR